MYPEFSLKVNGIPNPALFGDVVEIVVDTTIFSASMFTIVIEEKPDIPGVLKHVDNILQFKLGASVEISAKVTLPPAMIPIRRTLIKGEITAIEPEFRDDGRILFRVRGYDRAHRLMMGRKSRTFGDGNPLVPTVTEMQIISKIASENGLTPMVDPSGIAPLLYHFVMQYNQSDWDFLWARAQMVGYQVYVDDRFLHFERAGKERGVPVKLSWGDNLSRFEPRIVSLGGATSTSASGWDDGKKMAVRASVPLTLSNTMAAIPGNLPPGSKQIQAAFKKSDDAVVAPTIRTIAAARVAADARQVEHESQFVRASGEVEGGDPNLLAGTSIIVTNVGVRFSGKYYVTEARHIFRKGSYKVQFQVSGRNPYTVRNILMGKESDANKIDGVVIGVVTDVNDLESLGRVKVKYPWMPQNNNTDLASGFARVASPGAGKDRGLFFVPEVNDEVLIAFEQGDVNAPYIVGALWSKTVKPPTAPAGKAVVGQMVNQRIVRSRSGHVIVLDDTAGQEKITIQDKTGKNSIVIDSVKNSMDIKVQGDLTIDVTGKFTVKSKMDLLLDTQTKGAFNAKTKLDMQGQTGASLKAGSSAVDLQPAGAALKGAKVDVQGQAQTNIQGAQTSVKGTAMVEVQGALVKIN